MTSLIIDDTVYARDMLGSILMILRTRPLFPTEEERFIRELLTQLEEKALDTSVNIGEELCHCGCNKTRAVATLEIQRLFKISLQEAEVVYLENMAQTERLTERMKKEIFNE